MEDSILFDIYELFQIHGDSMSIGLNYLGFFLKPNSYHQKDWQWLIRKVQRRMNLWSPQWISLGGRNTLILSVLQAIPVYWFSLFRVPAYVMVCLRRLLFKFLWSEKGEFSITRLVDWKSLSLPSYWGGWGFKNLKFFNISLCAKSLWCGVSRTGIWGDIICSKYMKRLSFTS